MVRNIIFVEDLEDLIADQISSFISYVRKQGLEHIEINNISPNGFIITDEDYTIKVFSEKISFSLVDENIPEDIKTYLDALKEKYADTSSLFVVDLCLDNERSVTGEKVGEYLEADTNFKILYTSGTSTYWRINRENNNFVKRATQDGKMENTYSSPKRNSLFYPCEEAYKNGSDICKLAIKLLEGKYVNEQYFGVVIYKTIEM